MSKDNKVFITFLSRLRKFLSRPIFPIKASKLYRLCQVLRLNISTAR